MGRVRSYSEELERTKNSDEAGETDGAFDATAYFLKPSDSSFFCGNPLDDDLVYWSGIDEDNTQIWMHPQCSAELGQRLIKDALN